MKIDREAVRSVFEIPHLGVWRFQQEAGMRFLVNPGIDYRICLNLIRSDLDVVDWIYHVQEKEWCSPKILYDLVTALKIRSELR